MKKLLILLVLIAIIVNSGCIKQSKNKSDNTGVPNNNFTLQKPPYIDIKKMEKDVYDAINTKRVNNGLKQLKWNDEIANVARKQSQYLADLNTGFTLNLSIRTTDENGEYYYSRLNKAGIYYYNYSTESIIGSPIFSRYYTETKQPAEYYTHEEMVTNAVEGWMNSSEIREEILTPNFDEIGVGIATDSTKTNYIFSQIMIQRSDCGYFNGPCCPSPPGYLPVCYIPYSCISNICKETTNTNEGINQYYTQFVTPNQVKPYIDKISTWFVNDTEKDLDSIQQYVSQEIRYTVIPHYEWRTPIETLQGEGHGDCKDRATTFVSLAKAQNPSVQCFCVGWDTRKNEPGHLTAFCKVKNHYIFYDYGKIKTEISTGKSVETSEILGLLNQYISDYGLPVVSEVRFAFDDKNYYGFSNSLEFVEWVKKL